jgi:hypothetical protein
MNDYQNHPLAGADDLDSAMSKLWAFYKKYFVGMYIISVAMALLSGIITSGFDMSALYSGYTGDPQQLLEMMKGMVVPYSLLLIVTFVFGVFLHAWVLERPLGQENTILKALKNSLIALIPVLIVIIVFGIAGAIMTTIGLVLLVLPGLFAVLYISTVLIFALPVSLIETRNPGLIISRSFGLAHNRFWPNIAWVIILALIVIVIAIVIGGLTMLPFSGTFMKALADPGDATAMLEMAKNPLYIGISAFATALVTPVFPILAFIMYFSNTKENPADLATPEDENKVKVEDLYPRMPDNQ